MLDSAIAATSRRDVLAASHRVLTQAAEAARAAKVARERAESLLTDAEASLAGFATLDQRVTEHQAARIRSWASAGGPRPDTSLPLDLEIERRQRGEAAEHLAAAQAALVALQADEQTAVTSHAHAHAAAAKAATAVLVEDAERIANELREAQDRLWQLEDCLIGLGRVWLPTAAAVPATSGGMAPITLPAAVVTATQRQRRQFAGPASGHPPALQQGRWAQYHAALMRDPLATIEQFGIGDCS